VTKLLSEGFTLSPFSQSVPSRILAVAVVVVVVPAVVAVANLPALSPFLVISTSNRNKTHFLFIVQTMAGMYKQQSVVKACARCCKHRLNCDDKTLKQISRGIKNIITLLISCYRSRINFEYIIYHGISLLFLGETKLLIFLSC